MGSAYSALAIDAPVGALIASQWEFTAVGAIIAAVCLGSFKAATRMAPTAPVKGQQVPLRRILGEALYFYASSASHFTGWFKELTAGRIPARTSAEIPSEF